MTISTRTLITVNGKSFWATKQQAEAIAMLEQTRKGGFARIYGYTATAGRTVPTVYDCTVTSRFSYSALLKRKLNALQALNLSDILPHLPAKVSQLPATTLQKEWEARKQMEVESVEKTISGSRDDANRQGHDRCYISITDGVVIHLSTEKQADGLMHPVLLDGYPMAESVMLNCLEVSRNVRVAGEYKKVNSGVAVLISNAISAKLKAQGVRSMNRVSLKEGNFERVAIDTNVVLPEDMVALAEAA